MRKIYYFINPNPVCPIKYPGIEISDRYELYPDGRVLNKDRGRFLKPMKNNRGYCRYELVDVEGKHNVIGVQRLVAENYLMKSSEDADKIIFLDYDPTNFNAYNLRWVTPKEQIEYQKRTGRYGLNCHIPTMIRDRYRAGKSIEEIKYDLEEYGVTIDYIKETLKDLMML